MVYLRSVIPVVASIFLATQSFAGEFPVTGMISKGTEVIESEMLKIMEETGYSAATIAVSYNGKLVMKRGYGWQNKEKTLPINPSTRMRIASIDKCFGNVAAKSLIKRRKLKTTTEVFKFLKAEPHNGEVADDRVYDITLDNVLHHKLGWDQKHDGFHGTTEKAVRKLFETDTPTMEQFNSYMLAQPLQFKPGAKEVYSNYGSVVIRRVIEKAAKKPYLKYLDSICRKAKVKIAPALPVDKRKQYEIWYEPETAPYFDCFTISAPDLCMFFQKYWVSGEPRKGNGYVYAFFGSLPGTTSVIRQRGDGVNIAILFNERDKIGNDEVDRRIDQAVSKVKKWSTRLKKNEYTHTF